jgi:hypothetical protein
VIADVRDERGNKERTMQVRFSAVLGAAAAATISLTGLAQAPQAASQAKSPPGATAEQQVKVMGCVQRESDYRRARDAGRGGVAGTGVGAGNEFVLVNALASSGGVADPTFELTGENEGQAGSYVGRRVEITGKVKAGDVDAGGRPTGGATAGKPPEGVDLTSKDIRLRELEVSTVREASGTCPK